MMVSTVFRSSLIAGQQRDERGVDDDAAVLGVVDDVGQLLGREPDVERVQHRSHGGDGEIRLEVALVVPAEGADAVTLLDAQPGQGGGQLLGPGGHLGEGGRAVPALLDGDDGAVAVDPLPVAQDVADQERGVLHGAFHAPSMTWRALVGPRNDRTPGWARHAHILMVGRDGFLEISDLPDESVGQA